MSAERVAPLLVFGWGNASRGDDALGPVFVEALRERLAVRAGGLIGPIDWLDDYQLQVEHALDLRGRHQVLFVDASQACAAPFEASALSAARERGFSSHALSPQAVMQVYRDVNGNEAPACTLLAIRGEQFELGAPMSTSARAHLQAALLWGEQWLSAQSAALPLETSDA